MRKLKEAFLVLLLVVAPAAGQAAEPVPNPDTGLEFIDTSFENASPLWYETDANGKIIVHVPYDHERSSPNRAMLHYHFQLQGRPGAKLTLEFRNLNNVWNGRHSPVSGEFKLGVVSQDGREWTPHPLKTNSKENTATLEVTLPGPRLFVARVEPYRISDLDKLLESIAKHPQVEISPIGKTVDGRQLEIVRIGSPEARYRAFLRARAHPWEAGGNWVVQGLVRRLVQDDPQAKKFLERYAVYILPMANKDGVARGRSRFNLKGKDLNREWNEPADPDLAPENYALEQWLEGAIKTGRAPHLALELHNDGNGKLHISRPPVASLPQHLERMATFEELLRMHTWFTEGSTNSQFRNSGTLGEGWLLRYGIDAAVHEFNANWVKGLEDYPSGRHWETYGEKLATVFYEYFGAVKP